MAWRFLLQPDGKLALFSDVVDSFTYFNLTPDEAFEVATDEEHDLGKVAGREKVARGLARGVADRGGWNEALESIKIAHGQEALDQFLDEKKRADAEVEKTT